VIRRRRRDGNHSPQKNNSKQDSVGNKGNDPNKTMINVTKEPSDTHKKNPKEEILEEITEKFIKNISDMVNQNIQAPLKKF
jgi:hypothetical protein